MMRLIYQSGVFVAYGFVVLGTMPSCTPTPISKPTAIVVMAPVSIEEGSTSTSLKQSLLKSGNQGTTPWELKGNPIGVADNIQKDIEYYRKEAEGGNVVGQYNLGQVYNQGLGVREDYTQAAFWYRKAAEQGYAKAQYNLGYMYALGLGVPQDLVQAYMWINIASDQGLELAIAMLDDFRNNLTEAQIEEGKRLTREWSAAHHQKKDVRHYSSAQPNL
jgi:TPR repeat protein